MKTLKTVAAVACAITSCLSQAACLTDPQASALVDAYMARTPAPNLEGLSEADGACSRAKVTALLELRLGPVVGYKAGLTNPAVQKRFGYDKPVWGKLFEGMVLEDGAEVEAAFGARPLYEADLLVRVKSEAINQAKTAEDVLEAIDQVIPFVELPDLVVQAPPRLNGPAISAINVGARLGVAGKPIAVSPYRAERYALMAGLRDMSVVLRDAAGAELGRGKGSDILEHPLNAVVWLVQALAKEGISLQVGELVSLGSFSALLPPKPGLKVTATYQGLPGAAPVTVQFK